MLQSDSIRTIKGVGDKALEKYGKLGIESVGDLLEHYPRDYDEMRPIQPIRSLKEGMLAAIEGNLVSRPELKTHGRLKILTCMITDSSGMIDVTWFNMPFLNNKLHMGTRYILRGRIVKKYNRLVMEQPKLYSKTEFYGMVGKLRPIYPLTKGLTNNAVTKAVETALHETEDIVEYLPPEIRQRQNLSGYKKALKCVHFPGNRAELIEGRRRLVFDELFLYILALRHIRDNALEKKSSHVIMPDESVEAFKKNLPFELTGAQENAYQEIMKDMQSGLVMNRLVQGDVGSGKTVVALLALLQVVNAGAQGAVMVPTEVLARQHVKTFRQMIDRAGSLGLTDLADDSGQTDASELSGAEIGDDKSSKATKTPDSTAVERAIVIELLVGSMTAKQKREIKERLAAGEIDILIGTHALLQEDVTFSDLALVVTDEQHRFGVRQRETFFKKGTEPHVLAMSATPIPRTLALILYGDMDLTVIDEKPANRLPVKNALVNTSYRPNAYRFMKKRIAAGEQVYVICPMVEDSEDSELENVTIYSEELRRIMNGSDSSAGAFSVNDAGNAGDDNAEGTFREIIVEALHGRMKPKEKDDIMERFAAHEIDILVSTTVIEVGIDVPNATTMLIENAERFGLATLHQLRGRIGRGSAQSYCIFMMGAESDDARERLQIIERSNDGFHVASEDLKSRGQGDLFGTLQSGEKVFSLADIYEDAKILETAAEEAKKYSLKNLFFDKNDLTNKNQSFHDIKSQNKRLQKKISQYMGDVVL
ncbi:MAG: ATP-dependent DNA helicase RecG [Eubacterium sp.]|nr:ATP-dependent DNA helicase RecG [Eubacterium sp.]